ncbi:Gfo/Idh/MocA family protein [Neolewinella persica]|uniref:Gfo/Idh/MocA family protein n=1 Tax=Neolewinella persica TaxID=70998 RepID=UPI00037A17AC|nr:Gfo/Idh/MocA family oxidoreductase [Neolewinella persica]
MTKIACIGAGYFARFHIDAWMRLEGAQLVAICDHDEAKARTLADEFGVPRVFTDVATMCAEVDFEVADIITPPATHLALVEQVTQAGKHVICQKPLADTLAEAENIYRTCVRAQKRFMVHENFRFQPWHRELKRQLEAGVIGDKIHTITQRMRMGDGWAADAYLDRQPYFRTMPRLLMHETGIHYIDVLRYLAGDVTEVYAKLRTLNNNIAGEDCALVLLDFANGAQGVIDGNRYNEANHPNPRYTFGTTVIEGNGGTLRLYLDGRLTLQKLGETERDINYHHEAKGFAGDCVFFLQQHFLEAFTSGVPFETGGEDYLRSLEVLEAVYQSGAKLAPIAIKC